MLAPFTIARPRLSLPATTVFAAATAITFAATAAAPTPLYRLYQEAFGLTALQITLIFATYAVSIVVSFLRVRKPGIFVFSIVCAFDSSISVTSEAMCNWMRPCDSTTGVKFSVTP